MARRFSSRRWSAPAPQTSPSPKRREARHKQEEAPDSAEFGCLLIPHFSVWAARFNDPTLVSAPLIIHRKGRVFAACSEALTSDIRIGWPLQRAQSLCLLARTQAYDPGEEAYAWDEVLSTLYHLTPRIEPARTGLLYFEPPSRNSSSWLSTMAALAKQAKAWDAQVALASDRATAELAAHRVAPGTVRRIASASRFLTRASSTLLVELGLSPLACERLQWFGFKTVTDLQRLSREQIACQFVDPASPRDAALLWRFARAGTDAADRHPVQSFQLPPVRQSRVVLEHAATCPAEWERALDDAVQQATAQLGGMSAGVLTLLLETKAGSKRASKLLREPISSPRTLLRVANDLMSGMASQPLEVQSLEVRLSRLEGGGVQSTLFDTRRYDTSPRRHCPRPLRLALHNLESRHAGVMKKWRLRDQHAPLPEERFALVPAQNESAR